MSDIKLTNADLEKIKNAAHQKFMEKNPDVYCPDLFVAKCWTEAILDYLDKKGLCQDKKL